MRKAEAHILRGWPGLGQAEQMWITFIMGEVEINHVSRRPSQSFFSARLIQRASRVLTFRSMVSGAGRGGALICIFSAWDFYGVFATKADYFESRESINAISSGQDN
jgi:hypothetical protein